MLLETNFLGTSTACVNEDQYYLNWFYAQNSEIFVITTLENKKSDPCCPKQCKSRIMSNKELYDNKFVHKGTECDIPGFVYFYLNKQNF